MANRFLLPVFWSVVGTSVAVVLVRQLPTLLLLGQLVDQSVCDTFIPALLIISGSLFFFSGLALIILAAKSATDRRTRSFLILTGSAAVGIPASILLHNLVYGAFIQWFGAGFWGGGGDESFFFIMAVLVCPVAYLVGMVGSIILVLRGRKGKEPPCQPAG